MSSAGPILEVKNLTIALPSGGDRATAVRNVSFTVGRGEILCLVGESGSGKSVIAQGVMGLLPKNLPVQAGQILLEGEDITHAPLARLRELRATRMSMIFQEPMTALNPVMTCGDQIDEVLSQHTRLSPTERREKVLNIVREVLLPDPERMVASYPHQLSGGQRQRVVIAIALACGPDVLIADEPTTALDVTIQREVLDLIAQLVAEDGMALLLISHDLGVMAENVDRLLVMYGGTVVESGPTEDVFHRRAHPYTRGLFAARPQLGLRAAAQAAGGAGRRHRLTTIPGRVPELIDLPAGCGFADRCGLAQAACRAAPPPAVQITPQHQARCLRLDAARELA